MNKKIVSLSLVSALFLIGCGGGGGSSGTPSIDSGSASSSGSVVSVKGIVVDPEIEGASVSIECEGLRPFHSSKSTGEDGTFTINGIPSSVDLSTCTLISKDGEDSGDNLKGITLKAPYSMYNTNNDIFITPLTTLVAENEEYKTGNKTNKEKVKQDIANYFGLTLEDLTKNPANDSNIKIAKVTKKITKTAISKDTSKNSIGLIDTNQVQLNGNKFDDYLEDIVKKKMNTKNYDYLKSYIDKNDKVKSINEMKKLSITENLIEDIKDLYYFFEDDDSTNNFYETNKTALDANIKYMADVIAKANSKKISSGKIKYRSLSSFHLRKALSDLGLSAQFELDRKGNNDYSKLKDTLKNELLKSKSDFESYISSKKIDLSKVKANSFIIYNANEYEKVLGNSSILRKDYYIHSDVSNVAKAHSLINTLSDRVNDPINSFVASALGKFGFYDEAISHIEKNIYQTNDIQEAYRLLGKTLLDLGKNEEAAKAFSKEYKLVLSFIKDIGKAELGSKKGINLRNDLVDIARYLGRAGFYEDNNQKEIIGANTVTSYLSSAASLITTISYYSSIVTSIDNLAVDVYYYNEDLEKAKNIFERNLDLIDDLPTDHRSGIYHLYKMAIHANIYGLDANKAVTKAHSNELNPGNTHTELKDNYGQYPIIYEALTGDINTAITQLSKLKSSFQDDAIQNGMGAALFLRGKKDKLFNIYYGDDFYYDRTKKDFLMSKNVFVKPSGAIMSTMQMIKIKGGNEELKDYLNRLVTLAQTWYVISDKEEDKANNISDSDAQKVYGMWGNAFRSKYGYMAIAAMYKSINEEEKAKDTINKAITKVNAFSDSEKKITGLINIWDAIEEFGYSNDFDKNILLQGLEDSALNEDLDSDIKYTKQRIQAANILSINGKKDEAKLVIEKAYALIPSLINKDKKNVETRFSYLAGNSESTNENFENSIANGYLQAVDAKKAEEYVNEAFESIKTLGSDGSSINTGTQYKYLASIVAAYGKLNNVKKAQEILNLIKSKEENDEAILEAAEALATYDAFSSTNIASIDFDGDGDPDFFDIETSDKGELKLDIDIDGDEIEDDTDSLPYYKKAK